MKINSSTSKILEREAELVHNYLDRLIDLIIDFTPDQILNLMKPALIRIKI